VKSKHNTSFMITYNKDAIYFAGFLQDTKPDSISYMLSQRDDFGNADWVGVMIDPYANNLNAFGFYVTSMGVELDAMITGIDDDYSWNAVWKSAVTRLENGWAFEMRIPFSALRFPNKALQDWNINVKRQVRRIRETSYWNPVNPEVYGEITQSGVLKGLKNIEAPLRLSFTPYVTGYVENSFDSKENKQSWKYRKTGGMDLKMGLNDAFTLDMTLIPDFGQTVSDKQVLNLGPYEVRFDENRPFFIEGTELFGIGNLFYSRRIGSRPFSYGAAQAAVNDSVGEKIIANPSNNALINGSKVSGRTKNGLGIGIFNALEGKVNALLEDSLGNTREIETNPLTNYSVLVLSQNLKNNSVVSFVNTNVTRFGSDRDANVTAADVKLFSSNRKYLLSSTLGMSQIAQVQNRSLGHQLVTSIGKVQGSWNYSLTYAEISHTYDPNDLGFLYINNSRSYEAKLNWNDFVPSGKFLRKWASLTSNYSELYKPAIYSNFSTSFTAAGTFRNFLTAGINGTSNPFGSVDHFESRKFGNPVRFLPSYSIGGFYSSDYSKPFALDIRSSVKTFSDLNQTSITGVISPRIRVSSRLFFVWASQYDRLNKDYGYVSILDEAYAGTIQLGVRNRDIVSNSLSSELIFTNRMGVNLVFRHYWQRVAYDNFVELQDNGWGKMNGYNPVDDSGNSLHNTSYNAFTIDLSYRWVFFPGSELRVVWKNNIFNSRVGLDQSYLSTFNSLFDQPQINSISLKFLFYIDSIYFRAWKKKA
jgi:hypothetical protein